MTVFKMDISKMMLCLAGLLAVIYLVADWFSNYMGWDCYTLPSGEPAVRFVETCRMLKIMPVAMAGSIVFTVVVMEIIMRIKPQWLEDDPNRIIERR